MNKEILKTIFVKNFAVTRSLAKVTFKEIIKDKVLYNSLVISILLLIASYLASRLTFVGNERVVVDFGLAGIRLSCALVAILFGAPLLAKEIERRTILIVLSRPVHRFQYMLGKFAGLCALLTVNWALLCLGYLAILMMVGGGINGTIVLGLVYALMHSIIIGAVAIMFSVYSTTSLSVMFSFGIYLVGNNIEQIRFISEKVGSAVLSKSLIALSYVFPNFEFFNLGTHVTYGIPVTLNSVAASFAYFFFSVALFLFIIGLLIQKKEI